MGQNLLVNMGGSYGDTIMEGNLRSLCIGSR